MTPATIELSDPPDPEAWPALMGAIARHNEPFAGPHDPRSLVLLLRDGNGRIAGGLWGRTQYCWLYVLLLVVPDAMRRRGVGTALLRRAEAEASGRGCIGAVLDTFSFQARPFYEAHGYGLVGELADFPPGHSLYVMQKRLDR